MSVTTRRHATYLVASLFDAHCDALSPSLAVDIVPPPQTRCTDVCCVTLEQLDPAFVDEYELLRTRDGKHFRFIDPHDTVHEVHYQHAELQRHVLLGRFTDDGIAALAHAMARAHEDMRVLPCAAQLAIEKAALKQTCATLPPSIAAAPPVEDLFGALFD